MNIRYFRLALGVLAIINGTVVSAASVVDIPKIAGQGMKQVGEQLKAKPTCAKNKYGTKYNYNDGRVEIVYINGKADWITVNGLEQIPFEDAGIVRLGFSQKSPSFHLPTVMRWNNVPNVLEVSMFKGKIGTDYAYIKVKTP